VAPKAIGKACWGIKGCHRGGRGRTATRAEDQKAGREPPAGSVRNRALPQKPGPRCARRGGPPAFTLGQILNPGGGLGRGIGEPGEKKEKKRPRPRPGAGQSPPIRSRRGFRPRGRDRGSIAGGTSDRFDFPEPAQSREADMDRAAREDIARKRAYRVSASPCRPGPRERSGKSGAVGRRLDFRPQEFNRWRSIHALKSKRSRDIDQYGLAMKTWCRAIPAEQCLQNSGVMHDGWAGQGLETGV